MSENQKKILQMLSEGKISVDEAQRLLALLGTGSEKENKPGSFDGKIKYASRYMHVIVEPKPGVALRDGKHEYSKVNVRVPFNLIRAGMKLATLIPPDAADRVDCAFREKGLSFDIRKIKDEDIEEIISALHDSEINVDTDNEIVRVYAE